MKSDQPFRMRQLLKATKQDCARRHQLHRALRKYRATMNYDLTEEEKQQLVLQNFSWFVEHKIAGVAYPGSEDALAMLKALGVGALLSLSEQPLPTKLLTRFELQAEHLPVADFTAPTISQVEQAIAAINRFLEMGLSVAVNCGAGLGRTGTILACYLVWQGVSAQEAVESVRTQRPGSIETAEQEAVVRLYERNQAFCP